MSRNLYALLILLVSFSLQGQVCMGNLGENIFEDGDFGSGPGNISSAFPDIAPGYSFTFSAPPLDGFYTVANSTNWPAAFSTWLKIGDAGDDPNGYMMIVNADFAPGLFYDQEVSGLCENTLYEFSADAINLIRRGIPDHIAPNITFLLDGVSVAASGNIPQDEIWHEYGVLFTTGPSQTSVKLSIRNNAPGGIGNDLGLDNISFRACGPEALILPREIENICEDGNPVILEATVNGNQFANPAAQWQISLDEGLTWNNIPGATGLTTSHTELKGGIYLYRYLLASNSSNLQNPKCRIVSNVKAVYVQPKFWSFTDTICEGNEYFSQGNLITESGIYTDSLISSLGCDSVVTLNLTIVPDPGIEPVIEVSSPTCVENLSGEISVTSIENGNPPYSVFVNGSSVGSDVNLTNLGFGQFEFVIRDRFGCEVTELVDLIPPDEFEVEIGNDVSLILGDLLEVNSSATQTVQTYSWEPTGEVNCQDCPNQSFYPSGNLTLILNAESILGCESSDTIQVEVTFDKRVYIPSAFSPNNDGINDIFNVYAQFPNVSLIKNFRIFDRWGNMLFDNQNIEPADVNSGWNGEFKGKPVDIGVYTYLAEIVFLNGQTEVFSGDVSLIR